MTDNIKELVRRLRSARWHGTPFSQDAIEAAAALEAMAAGIERLKLSYEMKAQDLARETLKNSMLRDTVSKAISLLKDNHEPGAWSRGCRFCSFVNDARKTLEESE